MAMVLVVDDEDTIVDLLAEVISEAGHLPLKATNGREALMLAHQHHPTLVISDVMMPQMDGYALVRALRADPELADTMVILISAGFRPEHIRLGTATAFVPKPLDLGLIERLLPRVV